MFTTLILYGLATYGGVVLVKKVGKKVFAVLKGGNVKEKLLTGKTMKKLAGRK